LQRRCARRRRNGQARVKAASASSGKDASRHGPRGVQRCADQKGGAGRTAVPCRAEEAGMRGLRPKPLAFVQLEAVHAMVSVVRTAAVAFASVSAS
jgi:hypothetical protein